MTYVSVHMECYWTVNLIILTSTPCQSIWRLLFNNNPCPPQHKSIIVQYYILKTFPHKIIFFVSIYHPALLYLLVNIDIWDHVTMQNGWNNRISDGCVYAQIRRGLGMHLVTYSNHDTVLFLLIVPIKGRFVWDWIHCVYIYQRLHDFLTLLEYLGNLVRFSIYKGWNFPFLLGEILNIPLKGSI